MDHVVIIGQGDEAMSRLFMEEADIILVHLEKAAEAMGSITDCAMIQLEKFEALVEHLRIDELPDYPRTTNCRARKNSPCKAPDVRGRGPQVRPVPLAGLCISFNLKNYINGKSITR